MQELVVFGACEKYACHRVANFLLTFNEEPDKLGLVFLSVICEQRRQQVLFLDGESNVEWCSAVTVLNNWNLKGNRGFYLTVAYYSFFSCLKKSQHNVLIIKSTIRRITLEAIVDKIVQNGVAARENIHSQLNTLVMVHILNFNFFVVQNFCQDQPIQNSEG